LHDAAVSIGHVVINWSSIEAQLDEFIGLLAGIESDVDAAAISVNMDLRGKIQAIKALAYVKSPFKEWLNKVVLLLDYIDNDLRPRRNRVVHDHWVTPGGRLTRVERKTKVIHPQAFQNQLLTETATRVSLKELRQLEREMQDLFFIMFAFWYDYAYPEIQRSLPIRDWKQFVRRAKPKASSEIVNAMRQFPKVERRSKPKP
jgi:hypothetical protein